MRHIGAALVLLSLAVVATAQERPAPDVDVDRLPIDLSKIRKELQRQADTEERVGLDLRYNLHVYGVAPRLLFFAEDEDLTTGPVPWGAPTHREMIEHVTPQEFRAPVADFTAFFRWLADRQKKK